MRFGVGAAAALLAFAAPSAAHGAGVGDLMALRGYAHALVQLRPGVHLDHAELVSRRLRIWRVPRALTTLRMLTLATRIEPDRRVRTAAVQIDPLVGFEWWRAAVGADRLLPPGPGKPLTVIDTGLDVTHPDFAGRPNTNLLNPQVTPAREDEEHGTAVTSVAGAPENGIGVLGVYPAGVLNEWDSGDLFVSDVIEAIDRAIDAGPGVINMSFGFEGYDAMLADEVDVAFGNNVLLVAAAGNDFQEGNVEHSPANLHHVLTIGATDEANRSSAFSNRSLAVDLSAPGENIPVAVPTWASASGYASADGTSFSAPIVAGAAAWVWTVRRNLHVTQLFDLLRWSARDIEERGYDEDTGYGLLDIPAALSAEAPPVDPHEPNEDIYEIVAGKLFRDADTPLTSPRRGRATVHARLDVTEDPRDVYRVWVPARRRVVVRVRADDDVDVQLWDPTTPTVNAGGATRRRHLLGVSGKRGRAAEVVSFRNAGARGVYVFLDVFVPERGTAAAAYRAALTTVH